MDLGWGGVPRMSPSDTALRERGLNTFYEFLKETKLITAHRKVTMVKVLSRLVTKIP